MTMDRRELLRSLAWAAAATAIVGHASIGRAEPAAAATGRRVLIIGAGIAGLAAARALRRRGIEVLVIEGSDRIGGRIRTSREWPGVPIDLGASWIHGIDGNPITRLARESGARLATTSYGSSVAFDSDGTVVSPAGQRRVAAMGERVAKALRQAQRAGRDQSVRSAVQSGLGWSTLSPEERKLARFIMTSTIEAEYSGSIDETSAHWFDSVGEFPGPDALLPDGYSAVVDTLARGIPVVTGAPVGSVTADRDGVRVAAGSRTYTGGLALVTLPLGVLKAGSVAFSPGLPPAKVEAIQALQMGVLDKVFLRFPQVFWDPATDWIEYIPDGGSQWAEWVSLARPTGQPILLGFTAAGFARRQEARTDAQVVASAMRTLRTMYGPGIPEPTGQQITRWAADPFALGSYSFNALGAHPRMREALAEPVGDRFFFAGEATEGRYFGTVHGAYLSGLRAAKEIARTQS